MSMKVGVNARLGSVLEAQDILPTIDFKER